MMYSLYLKATYFVFFLAIHLTVHGYPLMNKNEKHYPNGTVIGKYTYTDNEGNPIHVKYFADDASYGVELKSFKVINTNSDSLQAETQSKLPAQLDHDPFEMDVDPVAGFKGLSFMNKNLTFDSIHDHKDNSKADRKEDSKNNADYEIFLQNEVKAPEKCGKEKVKIYFDKDKRKTRSALKKHDAIEYCNRF